MNKEGPVKRRAASGRLLFTYVSFKSTSGEEERRLKKRETLKAPDLPEYYVVTNRI